MAYAAPDDTAAEQPEKPAHKPPSLDTRKKWIEDWMISTRDSRDAQDTAEKYYYGHQRTPKELADLKGRKQPPTVDNLIRRKVNTVRGEEIEKRVDPVAKPRTPKHEAEAHAYTDALRFVEEDQDIDGIGGEAILDGTNVGIMAAIVECDSDDGNRCLVSHIYWRQVAVDPRSRRRDCADARWIANIQWFDLEDALEIEDYAHAEAALRAGVDRHGGLTDDTTEDRPTKWFDGARKRVRIVEMYYRAGKDWYRCDFTEGAELRECAPSPYLDPKTKRPWCPIIVRRVYLDHENMVQGPVHDMISPQDEINKRKSKSLHLLSVDQMIYEDGAIDQPQEAQQERAKADGAIKVNPGALSNPDGPKVIFNRNMDLVQGQVQMLQEAKQALESIGGASATLPDLPQSASGIAIARRQKSATRELGPLFETVESFRLAIYWHVYGCIKQFWTDEMWLRVTDDEATAGYRWVALNRKITRAQRLQELLQQGAPLPAALENAAGDAAAEVMQRVQMQHQMMTQQAFMMRQPPPGGEDHLLQMILQDPAMQELIIENNVAEAMMDITIHESPETDTLEEEEFGKLLDATPVILQTAPQIAPIWTRMIVKFSTFKEKREILEELNKPPDPQQAQLQQAQQQLQMQGAQAGVAVQQTQAQLNAARAAAEQAKMQISGAKAPSEIQKNQASAMLDAAHAGARAGGY